METHISTTQSESNSLGYWGALGTIIWGLGIFIFFIALQVITIMVYALRNETILNEDRLREYFATSQNDGNIMAATTIVTAIVCCALIAGVIKLKRGSRLMDYLAIRKVPGKTVLYWLAGLFIFIVASDCLTYYLGRPVVPHVIYSMYGSANPVWPLLVALIVAAPLFEETFFRGFLFQGLSSSRIGAFGTIILTAFAWSIIHTQYDAYTTSMIFCIGLIFGAARLHTGSLLMPLALHAFSNIVSSAEVAFLRLN
jgi:membrane protease YdiL (CAAX protease family)